MPVVKPNILNSTFAAAKKEAMQKLPNLTQNQEVARLYRGSLKMMASWAIDRDIINREATKLRAQFDANRGCTPAKARRLIDEGEQKLFDMQHPDPYCIPYMPGGSLFMRNPPLPMSVCFPDGNLPDDAPDYTFNPDMTVCKPETGKSAVGSVLVDYSLKKMI
mmetsp:Transcript_19162/g.28379  ORF Transcript_19162/g.28379 Transcript_19162/m.28379 type:complete len:163 (-) Transcript_19162:1289-1777(-)